MAQTIIFTTLKTYSEQLGWVCGFQLAQSENVSKLKKRHKSSKSYNVALSFSLLLHFHLCFYSNALRTWTVVCEQAASHPPFPAFNFHHFTHSFQYKILSAPIFLRTRFRESSCKQKVTLHSASRVACIMLLPFLYLSVPLPRPYSRLCSDAETSSFYLACQISQPASAAFILHSTASRQLVWVALSGKRRRWICQKIPLSQLNFKFPSTDLLALNNTKGYSTWVQRRISFNKSTWMEPEDITTSVKCISENFVIKRWDFNYMFYV